MANFENWLKKIEEAYLQNEYHFADLFQHLHQYPELSRKEEKTSSHLKNLIEENTRLKILKTVNHGFLTGYEITRKPSLCLRGDIDALPIEEKTKLTYISNNKGIMHACGHDFHATATYAVAMLWDKLIGPLSHSPIFIFQHAEEPIPGGALDFIEAKVTDDISEIFGFHVEPNLDTGDIGLSKGWVNAQSIKVEVSISGPGGHSARPWDSQDPLKASIDIIHKLYADLPRETDIKKPFVFSVTQFETDNKAYNSIPQKAKWVATLRVSEEKLGKDLLIFIEKQIKSWCELKNLSYQFSYKTGAPPVINSTASIKTAVPVKDFLLSKNWKFDSFRSLGGEDFGWFSQIKPGFLIRVGVTPNGQEPIPLHSDRFKVDFSALKSVVTFYLLFFIERAGLVQEIKE